MNKIKETKSSRSFWEKVRKLFNDVHLWLGIASGLILFVVCLTGTIYTFSEEIQEVLNPELHQVEVVSDKERLSEEKLIEEVKKQLPEGKITPIYIPASDNKTIGVGFKKEGEKRRTTYLVDPYTAEVRGTNKGAGSDFFNFIFRLHRWLLLDIEIGRPIVGSATLIFIFIIISGWVIWFPQKIKNWRQGLKIKWNANWKRVNFDLHSTLGFYASFLLILMALTGPKWSFEWYRKGIKDILNTQEKAFKPTPYEYEIDQVERPLSYRALIKIADEALPYNGNYRLHIPREGNALIALNKQKTGFFAPYGWDEIKMNRFTGEVVVLNKFSEKPLNEKIVQSLYALHAGTIYGTFSKILYFIACLIATSLPITGTIIWINKLGKKSKKRKKTLQQQAV
ncbi:MAG: PepSY-associated TM helix domain-containing protein [Bacteroidota bacterium]